MRPVIKSVKTDANGNPLEIDPWTNAKKDIIEDIGCFCSFCEKYTSRSSLHVEHIFGKKCRDIKGVLLYDHLKFRWDNFLLACVNCNSVKGDKNVNTIQPFLPHQNNLLHYVTILAGGLVQIKLNVTGVNLTRTQAFIELIGLDRIPGHPLYSDKDDRWENRLKVYDIAIRQLSKYTANSAFDVIENIVDLARTNGYFSIWYYIFFGLDAVINALINGIIVNGNLIRPFPGTDATSFDSGNHFKTLPRP